MPVVNLHMMGRFGNQMFQYAAARGYCERHGFELRCDPWVGQKIFRIQDPPITEKFPIKNEPYIKDGLQSEIGLSGYFQNQDSIDLYARSDCRRWFQFRPEVMEQLSTIPVPLTGAHLRRGDYENSSYPVVSRQSYLNALDKIGVLGCSFISDECPMILARFHECMSFLPDFYRLMKSKILLRANSSFSWWAASLSDAEVFSPIIEGKPGGEQDCEFAEGNWPRLANFDFTTDLHLRP